VFVGLPLRLIIQYVLSISLGALYLTDFARTFQRKGYVSVFTYDEALLTDPVVGVYLGHHPSSSGLSIWSFGPDSPLAYKLFSFEHFSMDTVTSQCPTIRLRNQYFLLHLNYRCGLGAPFSRQIDP
jgi:hypothetical protein